MINQRFLIGAAAAAVTLMAIMAMCSAPASARDWYVKAEAGLVTNLEIDVGPVTIEANDGPTFGAYLGTSVGPVRLEAGVRHASASALGGAIDISAVNLTGTVYADHSSGFYIGAGPDYWQTEAGVGFGSIEDEGYGLHGTVGYAARVGDRTVVEVQYRHNWADLDSSSFTNGVATIGLRHRLGGYGS